jgi:hypothetical protein
MPVNQIKSTINEDFWMWVTVIMEVAFPLYLLASATEALDCEVAVRA